VQSLKKFTPDIWPAERFVISISLAAMAINLFQIVRNDVLFDWPGYAFVLFIATVTFLAGQFYRISDRSARIGAAMTGTGILIFFTMALSVFNYLLMPTARPSIDTLLVQVDAVFGYHWPDMVHFGAEHPVFNTIVKFAYLSTMPQLALLVIVLGLTGRVRMLHVLLVGVTITATASIVFWGFFPTHGASSLFTLPKDVELAADPVVSTAYGREIMLLAREGPGFLTPGEVKGLIGFPSYHAVLAFLAVYAARPLRWLFPIYLVVNILILPGTLMHGGHHLVDVPGGLVLFLVGIYLTEKVVGQHYETGRHPVFLEPEFGR